MDDVFELDRFKEECALDNGFSVLRLYQPDVWEDTNDWEEMTMCHLYIHEEPEVIEVG